MYKPSVSPACCENKQVWPGNNVFEVPSFLTNRTSALLSPMRGLIRIRLARFGRRHQPFYNIVVSHHKKALRKLPIEVIGIYNSRAAPLSPQEKSEGKVPVKDVRLDFLKASYWLGTGAQPSKTVTRLFIKAGLLPPNWHGRDPDSRKVISEKTVTEGIPRPPVR